MFSFKKGLVADVCADGEISVVAVGYRSGPMEQLRRHETENSGDDPRADLLFGTIPRLLAIQAERYPDKEAVVDGEVRLSTRQLHDAAKEFSKALLASGLEPGDRVALWAPNCAHWLVASYGIVGAGGILLPLNTRFKGTEAAYILKTARARFLVTVEGFLGTDYPAMLNGVDAGPLEEIVVIDHANATPTPKSSSIRLLGTKEIPVVSEADFVARSSSVSDSLYRERCDAISPDDPSDLIFTSGTTGHPKGVLNSHAGSLRTYGSWGAIAGLAKTDRYLLVNPLFHTFGYKAGALSSMMASATLYPEAVFDVSLVLQKIATEKITALPGPPTLFQSLLDHPERENYDLSSLRVATTGAAIVPVELVVAMREVLGFETVLTAYGLTEACGTSTMARRSDTPEIVSRTCGRAIPGVFTRVVDAQGNDVAANTDGELLIRGYNLMLGYFENESATREAIDEDGWLHTGDVARQDEAGNITITDRLKDMFTVGGFNAYPAEIEALLRPCPGVSQLAVIGVPDARLGEVGCVVLARPLNASPAEDDALVARVLSFAKEQMANYKVPRHGYVVDALPLNATGKVDKGALRTQFAQRVVAT